MPGSSERSFSKYAENEKSAFGRRPFHLSIKQVIVLSAIIL